MLVDHSEPGQAVPGYTRRVQGWPDPVKDAYCIYGTCRYRLKVAYIGWAGYVRTKGMIMKGYLSVASCPRCLD